MKIKNILSKFKSKTKILFIIGILLFSGSLIVLAITGIKWFGVITPIGGTLFILGWCILFIKVLQLKI